MRAPKGFGKRYFTLGAIQAHSATLTLQRCTISTLAHHRTVSVENDEDAPPDEDDPLTPEALQPALPGGRRRACHCNLHFYRRTCKYLRIYNRPRRSVSPYRYTHATLAPPIMFL